MKLFLKQSSFFLFFLFLASEARPDSLIPTETTEAWISKYSASEMGAIMSDSQIIHTLALQGKTTSKTPVYLATAGGPGSMKSTLLEIYLDTETDNRFVRADPDVYGLRYMVNTYIPSTGPHAQAQSPDYLKTAHEKWRGGSNYITNTLLDTAFKKRLNIAHGTTSTSPHVVKLYEKLKANGYRIKLLLCDTTDENRIASIKHREKVFYQSTPEDAVKKTKEFYERLPIYFQYADHIQFYWTDDFKKGSVLCGIWTPETGLRVRNKEALEKFIEKYDTYRNSKEELAPFTVLTARK